MICTSSIKSSRSLSSPICHAHLVLMVHRQLPKQRQRRRILMYLVYLRYLFKDNSNSKVYSKTLIKAKREIYSPIMKTNWLKIIKWNRAPRDCCNKEFYYMFLIIWSSDSNRSDMYCSNYYIALETMQLCLISHLDMYEWNI